jgi:hypothetical protein
MKDPKFKINDKVKVDMMGIDASMKLEEDCPGITMIKDVRDCGTGIVVDYNLEDGDYFYKIAVIEGRFDGHRDDMGELWTNEFELSPED